MKKLDRTKLRLAVIPLLIAFFSVFVMAGVASSPQFHADTTVSYTHLTLPTNSRV